MSNLPLRTFFLNFSLFRGITGPAFTKLTHCLFACFISTQQQHHLWTHLKSSEWLHRHLPHNQISYGPPLLLWKASLRQRGRWYRGFVLTGKTPWMCITDHPHPHIVTPTWTWIMSIWLNSMHSDRTAVRTVLCSGVGQKQCINLFCLRSKRP